MPLSATRRVETIEATSLEEGGTVRSVLRDFILESIALRNLQDDDDLFETGVVNSLFAVQLMTFIEKAFHIEIGVDDLDIQNFKSVNAATAFVLKQNRGTYAPAKSK